MKLKILLLGLVIVVALGACSEDDEPTKSGGAVAVNCNTFFTEGEYEALLEDLEAKGDAYEQDQSVENCQAYYASINTYISTWQKYVDKCVPAEAAATFNTYWSIYESYFDDLNCE
ncbi:MAG: hypothetical protein ABJG41_08495 [Cyclobacteriaceae bacterium]